MRSHPAPAGTPPAERPEACLSVVMPCFNEATTVKAVAERAAGSQVHPRSVGAAVGEAVAHRHRQLLRHGPGSVEGEDAGAGGDEQIVQVGADDAVRSRGGERVAAPAARDERVLGRCDAVVIGPGLGRTPSRADFILEVIAAVPEAARILLDADGLMAFAGQVERLRDGLRHRQAVLTPHAGEFRALFPDLAPHMDVDPWDAAESAAQRVGAIVLLKGVPTVVAGGERLLTVAAGNPGLATGGSGDTLSGLIATFAAQGIELAMAAAAAACVLGEAADLAARRVSARSMRPMDVLQALPAVWRRLDLVRRMPPPPRPPILHELPAPVRV